MTDKECECFFNAFGYRSYLEYLCLPFSEQKKHYRMICRLIHPDKHTCRNTETQERALRAKQLLILAGDVLFNEDRATEYAEFGAPDDHALHDCQQQADSIDFIRTQIELAEQREREARSRASRPTIDKENNRSNYNVLLM